jgi:DNA-binding beta-propeller fold protein YncE
MLMINSVTATITVGTNPSAISINPPTNTVYVANQTSSWSQLHPIKPAIDQRNETIFSNIGIVLNNLGNHTGAILYFDKALAIDPEAAL